ncbi:MAG: T9SS type A sorting domain-containing protein [bacterium]|nr:T9SS type A sorting domain-containing protein [bacterium]
MKNAVGRALTFKEIQLQFDAFKKENDLNKAKHWKAYKRYEMEMLLHTSGQGEPVGFREYVNVAIAVADEKEQGKPTPSPWYPAGPNTVPNNLTGYMENGIGRINCVAFHPTDTNTYYVGVAQGGLWRTTNGGASYTPLTDNLPITRISDIVLQPGNPNVIYISVCDFEYIGRGLYLDGKKRHTHFGLGVYKTTDGGTTWSPTGLSFQLTDGDASLIRKIVINPANTNELLACGVSGMYRSTNGGAWWTKQVDSLFWDMIQSPQNPNILYAATGWVKNSNMGSAAIYKSTDFGINWTLLNTGIPLQGSVQRIKLAMAPGDSNYVYALCVDDVEGLYGIYQSTNAGVSWTYKPPVLNVLEYGQGNGSGGQGTYDLGFCVSDTNRNVLYTGGINLWGSLNGGTSFAPISHWTYNYGYSTVHADVHAIQKQPGSGNIFVSCDGGLYKTNNMQTATWGTSWPTTWTTLSNGMQISSFYRVSSSKNSLGRIIAGAQDNASSYKNSAGWSTLFGGDGMDNYLDPLNSQIILGSSQYGNFYYSNDDGTSGLNVGTNPNFENSEWVTPLVADYNHPGVLYIGNENVVKSTDGGQNWNALGTIYSNTVTQQNTEICALAVSPTNSNVIYAARRVRHEYFMKGIVIRSTNGGTSFSNITNNLPDSLYYTGIEVNLTNPNEAVVSLAGFAAGCKVFKTTNGGASWVNITYNLPNIPVNCVKYVVGTGQLMVATDVGVYILNVGANSWAGYSTGLPNVIVSDIEFNPVLNKVYISTFGRGIWETSLNLITAMQPGLGIHEAGANALLDFQIYPSLNSGNFTVSRNSGHELFTLDVIDVLGHIVYSTRSTDDQLQLDLKLNPGTYYLKMDNGIALGVKKMVVQ